MMNPKSSIFHRQSTILVVLAAVVAAFAAGCGGVEREPVFACSWDKPGSLAADTTCGAAEPIKVSNTVQVEGKSGQGIRPEGKDAEVQYAIKGFNWQAGTVEFWLKPAWHGLSARGDWDTPGHRLFDFYTPAEGTLDIGMIAHGDGNLDFSASHAWKDQIYDTHFMWGSCADWTADEWHHVAVSWDQRQCRLYVDGVPQVAAKRTDYKGVLPTAGECTLMIGNGAAGGETYDQFRLYDYARSAGQVAGDWRSGADITVEAVLPMRDARNVRVPYVIYPDEQMAVRVSNLSGRDRTVELCWQVTDLSQPEFKPRKMGSRKVELGAGGNRVETVYAPKDEMAPYGLFEVAAEVKEGGKVIARRVRTFGAGPRPVDLSGVPESAFGLGVWSERLGAAITSYPENSIEPLATEGHNWYRVCVQWPQIEKEKGRFDWSKVDYAFESARRNHVNLMPCLLSTPDWASSGPDLTPQQFQALGIGGRWAFLPKDMKDWDNFVFHIVSRYKGYVKYWNIWNEPCYGFNVTGWDPVKKQKTLAGSPEEARLYYELVKTASLAAKRADPDAKIVIEPCWGSWLENLAKFEDGRLLKLVDVYAWHWYSSTTDTGPEVRIATIHDQSDPMRAKVGPSMRMWDTEGGLAVAPRRSNRPNSPEQIKVEVGRANPAFNWMMWAIDERTHAARTVRDYMVKWGEGVEKVFAGTYDSYSNGAQASPNVCCWRDGSPTLTSLATTVLTNQLSGAQFVRKLDAPAGHYAYLFRKGRRHVLVCWTTLGKSVMPMDLHAPAVTVTDLLGNSRLERTHRGILTGEVTSDPLYISGISPDARVLPERMKLALDAPIVAAGGKVTLTAEINNHFETPLQGELSLKLPAGWTCQPPSARIDVAPKGSLQSVFAITAPAAAPDAPYEIGVVLAQKDSPTAKTLKLMVKTPVSVPRVAKEPVIDGDLAKWQDSPPLMMNRRDQVKIGLVDPNLLIIQPYIKHEDAWKGPKDCSGEVRLGWDDKNLYVAVKVTDDDVMHRMVQFHAGDCFEMFIDLGAVKSGPGTVSGMGKILQPYFIPPVEGYPHPTFGLFQGADKLVGVRVASKRTAEGYTLEIAMPWSNIPGFTPRKGAMLCVDLAINDADKNYQDGKEVKSKILWHGGGDAYSTTANYGIWRLE